MNYTVGYLFILHNNLPQHASLNYKEIIITVIQCTWFIVPCNRITIFTRTGRSIHLLSCKQVKLLHLNFICSMFYFLLYARQKLMLTLNANRILYFLKNAVIQINCSCCLYPNIICLFNFHKGNLLFISLTNNTIPLISFFVNKKLNYFLQIFWKSML